MSVAERQQSLIDDYAIIPDSLERFQLIVESGRGNAKPFPESRRNEEHLVPGCVSRVWVAVSRASDGLVTVETDSEAPALQSIGALFSRIYSEASESEIRATEPDFIEALEIDRNLTPTRRRGIGNIRQCILSQLDQLPPAE